MGIMDFIQNQLGGDAIRNLSNQIGEDEDTTRTAVKTAIPTVLAALGKQASSGDGANKLASMLNSFDTSKLGSLSSMLSGQPGTVIEKGTSMLSSLLGGDMVTSITSAISRFTNMGTGGVKKLLAFAMPMVMGGIANHFRGKSVTPQGISGFFSNLMPDFTKALPSGFSLSSIPGLSSVTSAVQDVTDSARGAVRDAPQYSSQYGRQQTDVYRREPLGASSGSAARWVLPLVGLALVGLLAWNLFNRERVGRTVPSVTTTAPVTRETIPPRPITPAREAITQRETTPPAVKDTLLTAYNPAAAAMANKLSGAYTDAQSIMAGITDVDSAEAAVPELTKVKDQIDSLRGSWETLPDVSRSAIYTLTARKLPEFKEEMDRVLAIPGAADVLRPVLDGTIMKLANFKK